jgi:hypothetical protein
MVSASFRTHSRQVTRDLADMVGIPVTGITSPVRSSFQVIKDKAGVETLGFSFRQYGVSYKAFYKDEYNNDKCRFEIEVPNSPSFVHRHTVIGIAEKAHIVRTLERLLDENLRTQMIRPLHELEIACFDANSATFERIKNGNLHFMNNAFPHPHLGFAFPDDANYKTEPALRILALEWVDGGNHIIIDVSQPHPQFSVGQLGAANNRRQMTSLTALKYVEDAYTYARKHDHDSNLLHLASMMKLWDKLEIFAKRLPEYSVPMPS